jgi:hypothetical protein
MHVRHSFEEKNGGMYMANRSLARRQSTEVVVQQHTPGQVVARVKAQAQELNSLVTTAAEEYDRTRRALGAIVTSPGRSPGDQRYVKERIGYLQTVYDDGMRTLVTGAARTILNQAPTEIVRTIYVPEPRKSIFQALTGR